MNNCKSKKSNYWYNNHLTLMGDRHEIDSFINLLTSAAKKDYHIRSISQVSCGEGFCLLSFKTLWYNPYHLLKNYMKPFPQLTFQLEYDNWYNNVHNYLICKCVHLQDSFSGYVHDIYSYQPLNFEPPRGWKKVGDFKTVSKSYRYAQKEGTLG